MMNSPVENLSPLDPLPVRDSVVRTSSMSGANISTNTCAWDGDPFTITLEDKQVLYK